MIERKLSSREKILQSALSLFTTQGITATTTKQIAEQAGVNEVTLFRQFGSKHGLLLAVLEEAPILNKLQAALSEIAGADDPLVAYGELGLELLGSMPELVRSLIGEASQSPPENLQALGQTLNQASQQTIAYLGSARVHSPSEALSLEAIAHLLNTLIVGRAVMDFASGGHGLKQSQKDFLVAVNTLFSLKSQQQESNGSDSNSTDAEDAIAVEDLPTETVRSLFQKARKLGPQEYALVYVLFGAGLRAEEAAGLLRSHSLSSKSQHLLIITSARSKQTARQVPLNRWIMENRYGTYLKNPLTQWLKSRSDEHPEIFVDAEQKPLGIDGLHELWNTISADANTLAGEPITPFHARQTWCIELLTKGMSLENLSLLSGLSKLSLESYVRRAKEKGALEQALAIDKKGSQKNG